MAANCCFRKIKVCFNPFRWKEFSLLIYIQLGQMKVVVLLVSFFAVFLVTSLQAVKHTHMNYSVSGTKWKALGNQDISVMYFKSGFIC